MIPEMSGSYSAFFVVNGIIPSRLSMIIRKKRISSRYRSVYAPEDRGVISGVLLSVLPNTMKMIIFALWLIVHKQYQQSHPPKPMAKLVVKDTTIRTLAKNGIDYICITDIARQKNPVSLRML